MTPDGHAAGTRDARDGRDDPAARKLTQEAWRQLDEVVTTGRITLDNGLVIDVAAQPGVYMQTVRWIAALKQPKMSRVPLIEDYRPAPTDG
jgi:hypothetical protein